MEQNLSSRRILAIIAAVGAVLALVLAITLARSSAQAAVHRHAVHHAPHRLVVHRTRDHVAKKNNDPAGSTSTGNVQSGDQTTPDTTSGETTGEGESNVESEHGQPGEPANGHQDTGGNVDHQCDGSCVE